MASALFFLDLKGKVRSTSKQAFDTLIDKIIY